MKKILFGLLLTIIIVSCKDKTPASVSPFNAGDIAYFKLDTTRVVIKLELGLLDDKNFAYIASYKGKDGENHNKFVVSSELMKNK
jgi:hypothetical protein